MRNKILFLGYTTSALIGVWVAALTGIAGTHLLQSAVLMTAFCAVIFLTNRK